MGNKKKWLFYNGYVIIQIEGVYPERVASLLEASGVPLWDLRRLDGRTLICTMPARDFRKLHELDRRRRCRVRILKKIGGPFRLRWLWRRRMLLLGMACTLLLTWWASQRIWFVDIQGCRRMDEAVLRQALLEQGLAPGRDARALVLSDVGDSIAAQYDELAFLELHVDGVFLRVRAREAMAEGERLDLTEPCDLVSTRDGIVTKITAYGGRAQVRAGDRVKKGQLLIAGRVTARDGSMTYATHAYGEVLAAVLYKAQVEAPRTAVEWAETGATAPYAALYGGSWKWLERGCPFEDAELATDEDAITLTPWPLRVCYGTWREKVKTERTLTPAERKEAALFEAERMALLQVPRGAKIIMIDRYTLEKGGKLYGVCAVTTEENIGYTKEIS